MKNSVRNNSPLVSIVIPCRNEEGFIGQCLDSVVANDYPTDMLEILIVDGMSEDGTRRIVEDYSKQHPFIRLLDNPEKITPCAFNIGVKHSKGEVIMIMGAHAKYEMDYVSKCVKYLIDYGVDNVGGIMITVPRKKNTIGKAIAASLSNRFGVGNSYFRIGHKEPIEVDTVFGGCYKKEIFEKIGFFNENLRSTSDMEFNSRLKKREGRILLVPNVVSYYYTRSDFNSFCKNNCRNGFWAIYPFKYTKMPVSLRHLVPFVFVLSLTASVGLSFFFPFFGWLFLFTIALHFLVGIYFSIEITKKEKDFRLLFIMPIIFATLHISYGLGSIWGAVKLLRR